MGLRVCVWAGGLIWGPQLSGADSEHLRGIWVPEPPKSKIAPSQLLAASAETTRPMSRPRAFPSPLGIILREHRCHNYLWVTVQLSPSSPPSTLTARPLPSCPLPHCVLWTHENPYGWITTGSLPGLWWCSHVLTHLVKTYTNILIRVRQKNTEKNSPLLFH